MRSNSPLIVFSHLRWDFVYQRPQHLLSRLAAHRPVYFIEEPVHDPWYVPYLEISHPAPNVKVVRPHTRVPQWGYNRDQVDYMRPMLEELVEKEELTHYVVWLYTPMALPVAQTLNPRAVVFDVMDELSAFKDAPQELKDLEAETLRWADVVFTGGPSLYRAKQGRHQNVHCFPSSVDAAHFAQAKHIAEAEDQAAQPHPRLGFYGVIDERMDVDLLRAIAEAHPEWHIVMVGPVVKIDWATLPKLPNIHYLGQRTYEQLPSYLAGWDVCLLPFALNESTRFISPTKTLEYMAAEIPIVSTPITDVAEPYGDIVYIGQTHADFIRACEAALASSSEERDGRAEKMRSVLKNTSWDRTAEAMDRLVGEAEQAARPAAQSLSGTSNNILSGV
jgi:UDP-galactopyranose mutase